MIPSTSSSFSSTSSEASSYDPFSPRFDSDLSGLSSPSWENTAAKVTSLIAKRKDRDEEIETDLFPKTPKVGSFESNTFFDDDFRSVENNLSNTNEPLSPLKTPIGYKDPTDDVFDFNGDSFPSNLGTSADGTHALSLTGKRKECSSLREEYDTEEIDLFASDMDLYLKRHKADHGKVFQDYLTDDHIEYAGNPSSDASVSMSQSQEENALEGDQQGILEAPAAFPDHSRFFSGPYPFLVPTPTIPDIQSSKKSTARKTKTKTGSKIAPGPLSVKRKQDQKELDEKFLRALEEFHKPGNQKNQTTIAKEYEIHPRAFSKHICALRNCLKEDDSTNPITEERIKAICKQRRTAFKLVKNLLPLARAHRVIYLASKDAALGPIPKKIENPCTHQEVDNNFLKAFEMFHKNESGKSIRDITKECQIEPGYFRTHVNALKQCLKKDDPTNPIKEEKIESICKGYQASFTRIKALLPLARLHKEIYFDSESAAHVPTVPQTTVITSSLIERNSLFAPITQTNEDTCEAGFSTEDSSSSNPLNNQSIEETTLPGDEIREAAIVLSDIRQRVFVAVAKAPAATGELIESTANEAEQDSEYVEGTESKEAPTVAAPVSVKRKQDRRLLDVKFLSALQVFHKPGNQKSETAIAKECGIDHSYFSKIIRMLRACLQEEDSTNPITEKKIKAICQSNGAPFKRVRDLLPLARVHRAIYLGSEDAATSSNSLSNETSAE